jgi:hypothetical protein
MELIKKIIGYIHFYINPGPLAKLVNEIEDAYGFDNQFKKPYLRVEDIYLGKKYLRFLIRRKKVLKPNLLDFKKRISVRLNIPVDEIKIKIDKSLRFDLRIDNKYKKQLMDKYR